MKKLLCITLSLLLLLSLAACAQKDNISDDGRKLSAQETPAPASAAPAEVEAIAAEAAVAETPATEAPAVAETPATATETPVDPDEPAVEQTPSGTDSDLDARIAAAELILDEAFDEFEHDSYYDAKENTYYFNVYIDGASDGTHLSSFQDAADGMDSISESASELLGIDAVVRLMDGGIVVYEARNGSGRIVNGSQPTASTPDDSDLAVRIAAAEIVLDEKLSDYDHYGVYDKASNTYYYYVNLDGVSAVVNTSAFDEVGDGLDGLSSSMHDLLGIDVVIRLTDGSVTAYETCNGSGRVVNR